MEWGFGTVLFLLFLLVLGGGMVYDRINPMEAYRITLDVSTEVEEQAAREGIPVYQMAEIAVGDKQVEVTNILSYVDEINVRVDGGGVTGRAADARTFMAVARENNVSSVYYTLGPSLTDLSNNVYEITKAYVALDQDRRVITVLAFEYNPPGEEILESCDGSAAVFVGERRRD